ncbi:MAG: response regulator [Anaerolineae bacterium]
MTDPIRILLADDRPTLRVGLRISLQQAPDIAVVAEACTGPEALAQSAALLPDVALLDCVLPELAGPAVAAEIRRRGLPVRVLALSGHDDAHFLAAMHDAGAAGYLLKDASPASILAAVRQAARGEPTWQPEQLARIAQWRAEVQRPWASLTERKRAIMLAVGCGESNRDIARRLHITERTVEFHMSNVLGKLTLPTRAAAVAWVKDHAVEQWGV